MRIVVKIGSSSLVDATGQRQVGLLGRLVDDIATAVAAGHEVVLVSSGAIATGLGILGQTRRPTELPALQGSTRVRVESDGETRDGTLLKRGFEQGLARLCFAKQENTLLQGLERLQRL